MRQVREDGNVLADAPDIGIGSQTIHNAQQHRFVLRGMELDKYVYESRVHGLRRNVRQGR